MAGMDRTPEGLRLRLAAGEVEVVASLAEGLAGRARAGAAPGDTVLDRLAPQVSRGDSNADHELRPLLRDDLLSLRATRLDDLAGLLRDGVADAGDGTEGFARVLDCDGAMRVVEALNDLRLALATTIGHDGARPEDLDDGDHRADAVRLLDALAWLQGGLIGFIEEGDPG